MTDEITIESRDYWFKVIEMLQQNWALIEETESGVTVFFVDDASGVFDEISFDSVDQARSTLRWNGFERFADDPEALSFLHPPKPPFRRSQHCNGPIYSSGRFWRQLPKD